MANTAMNGNHNVPFVDLTQSNPNECQNSNSEPMRYSHISNHNINQLISRSFNTSIASVNLSLNRKVNYYNNYNNSNKLSINETNSSFECKFCQFSFVTNEELMSHINISHSTYNPTPNTNTNTNTYAMDFSTLPNIDFSSPNQEFFPIINEILPIKHEQENAINHTNSVSVETEENNTRKTHKPHVNNTNINNNNRNIHVNNVNSNSQKRHRHNSMQCRYCRATFTKNKDLMEHIYANHLEQLNENIRMNKQVRDKYELLQMRKQNMKNKQNNKKRKRPPIDNIILEPPKPPKPTESYSDMDNSQEENENENDNDNDIYKPKPKKRKRPCFNAFQDDTHNKYINPLQCKYCWKISDDNTKLIRHIDEYHKHLMNNKKNNNNQDSESEPNECDLIEMYSDNICNDNDKNNIKSKKKKKGKKKGKHKKKHKHKKNKTEKKDTKMKGLRPNRWKTWDPKTKKDLMRCTHCTYKTNSTSHLRDHALIHTGEKPFSCEKCNQKFRQKSHLKTHMKRYHENKRENETDS